MKANRKFVNATEAVSPVIAVILMVAITVVLAATVFVLVSDIGSNTASSQATISWAADETMDRLVVNSASQNADWYKLTVQVDSCTITPAGAAVRLYAGDGTATSVDKEEESDDDGAPLGAASATTSCGAPSAVRIGTASAKIESGDYIDFCAGPAAGVEAVTTVKVTFMDTSANAIQHTHTFTNVARCP
jgi:archaeal type IV pilus assembly protein PilA